MIDQHELLEVTATTAKDDRVWGVAGEKLSVRELDPGAETVSEAREEWAKAAPEPSVPSDPRVAALRGLEQRDAEILLAVLARPRSTAEFAELARARQVSAVGAADRINDWGREQLGMDVLDYGEVVAIVGRAVEPLHELLASA